MSALLEIRNLKKEFAFGSILSRLRITAVDDVSFDINTSEIFALAGESGCGKTTTARMILGFEEITAGSIDHKRSVAPTDTRRDKVWLSYGVQAIFQNPFETFNPLRPVERYFFETVRNYKLADSDGKARTMVDETLRAVGLSFEEVSGRYPSEFSGGQLQRVSIARSLLTSPRLLIADEPVSMVDASLRMSIVNLFKQLRDEMHVSVLYITHDLATAYYVSDRIGIMFRGNLIELGAVENVLMQPKHPYTQLLRESIPEADPNRRWTERVSLSDIEHEEYMRKGCRFAGRCPKAMEICRTELPEDLRIGSVMVKCHLYAGECND